MHYLSHHSYGAGFSHPVCTRGLLKHGKTPPFNVIDHAPHYLGELLILVAIGL